MNVLSTPSLPLSVLLVGGAGSLVVSRPGPAVIFLRPQGEHANDLRQALEEELEVDYVIQGKLQLFIDGRERAGMEMVTSPLWASWLRAQRAYHERVVAFVPASFAAPIEHGLLRHDPLLEVQLEEDLFEAELALALKAELVVEAASRRRRIRQVGGGGGTSDSARSASAVMVSDGFTPGFAETLDPSITKIPG